MDYTGQKEITEALEFIFAELTAMHDDITSQRNLCMAEAKMVRLAAMENKLDKLEVAICKYNAKCSNPEDKIKAQKFAFSSLIDSIRGCYFELKAKKDVAPQMPENTHVRLPKVNIPLFSGLLEEWSQFHAIFKDLVHNNKGLGNVEKFQFLRSSLRGNALKVIESLPVAAENYEIAYDLLLKRYDSKRLRGNIYAKRLLEFKPIAEDSPSQLQSYLLALKTNVEALKALQLPDVGDFLLLYKALSVLDPVTRKLFESEQKLDTIPTFDELMEFVETRLQINTVCSEEGKFVVRPKPRVLMSLAEAEKCPKCQRQQHHLYECREFLNSTVKERYDTVRKNKFCFNCLSPRHMSSSCQSKKSCSRCNGKHHTLLHYEKQGIEQDKKEEEKKSALVSVLHSPTPIQSNRVLLSTVVVEARDRNNQNCKIRMLVDSGSQVNLLTNKCCRKLGLPIKHYQSSVTGISQSKQTIRGMCSFTFSARFNSKLKFSCNVLIVDNITTKLPQQNIDVSNWSFLKDLQLADEEFHTSSNIDGILGANMLAQIMGSNVVKSGGTCCAIETDLGYVIIGSVSDSYIPESVALCAVEHPTLEEAVRRFWTLEELPADTAPTSEDEICETIFQKSCKRDPSGKYSVDLPFRDDPSVLGDSLEIAKRRFLKLEKRLIASDSFREMYHDIVRSHINLGYLQKCSNRNNVGYFLPHHGILKTTSTSTPLRMVYDAGCKTTSGKSLNDILFVGPKLQADLTALLLRFRLFPIAITADIKQMYLRIGINEVHRKFQRLLWRFHPQDPLEIYELTTVTFGMSSSPYLALRTVRKLLEDYKTKYPQAAEIASRDIYMDDLVTSCESVEEATKLFQDLRNLFQEGNFQFVKWNSNSAAFLDAVPPEIRLSGTVEFDTSDITKILGLHWYPADDVFTFKIDKTTIGYTKRAILSTIAHIFDPLGLICCITVYFKILLKTLWSQKLDWDEVPPEDLLKSYKKFIDELPALNKLKIPRYLGVIKNAEVDLVGFCDASAQAYGAVIYLRSRFLNSKSFNCSLLIAKSKVAPQKSTMTIPRLELCSAHLLSLLLKYVITSFKERQRLISVFAFTDSRITLSWIKSSPQKWKTFVSNRVLQISQNAPDAEWFHVKGKENPADYISRSVTPTQLLERPLWFHGPSWLREDSSHWPIEDIPFDDTNEGLRERRQEVCMVATGGEEHPLLILANRCSTWSKLLKSCVFVLRFIGKIKTRQSSITPEDMEVAENYTLRVVQNKYFKGELSQVNKGRFCRPEIQKLQPFISNGLLRVGGRLKLTDLDYNQKHPILLPKNDRIVELLIRHYHEKFCHSGPQLLTSMLRQKFWILSARSIVRKIIRNCVVCFKVKPKITFPSMADLPNCRVTASAAFAHTGVDYAGPFSVTLKRGRGHRTQKAYLCLFICMSTKAVHIEVAPDLTSTAFLNTLKRFLSRRGRCDVIYSDQGTNFVGAKGVLEELYQLLSSKEFKSKFQMELLEQRITWKMIPPAAPHFGGLWEGNIKSMKSHLSKVVGSQILTLDEFVTVATQVEAILNSRPLTVMSPDPGEPACLTPAHFLVGRPLQSLPSLASAGISGDRLIRPNLLDSMVRRFWERWRLEYLHTLQARQKWLKSTTPPKVGTIVLVQWPNVPSLQWPLGRIEELFPGPDGVVRVVAVKTSKGRYVRPLVKLCPLPNF